MKKLLGLLVMLLLTGLLSTTALAAQSRAYCSPDDATAGDIVSVYGFYDKNGEPCEDEGAYDLADNYTVSASWTRGSDTYISGVTIDKDTGEILLTVNPNPPNFREREIFGTITLRSKRSGGGVYTAILRDGSLILNKGNKDGKDTSSIPLVKGENGRYILPEEYQTKRVSFKVDDGDNIGQFTFDFGGYATYRGTFMDQDPLLLAFNTKEVTAVAQKYPNAYLQYLTWTGKPKFRRSATLAIPVYEGDYVYEIAADGTLRSLNGSYKSSSGCYEFSTNTLGSYVISEVKLSTVAGSASSSSTPPSSSSTPPPSSSVAPSSSSSVAPPPSSSSVAPPPSSSSVAPSSSAPPSSSIPEVEPPESVPEPEPDPEPEPEPDPEPEPEKQKGKFPLLPVLLGVGTVLVVVLLFVLLGGQKGGRRPRFEDWDD